MLNDDLTALMTAQPFQPFTIRLSSGKELSVRHPDFLFRLPTGRTVIVVREDGGYDIIDMILVENFSVDAPPTGSRGTDTTAGGDGQ